MIDINKKHPNGWEVVYFLNPYCSGNCSHCWSINKFLGNRLDKKWHISFFEAINYGNLRKLRITGGEPLEYNDIPDIMETIYVKNKAGTPVYILTSGRKVISIEDGPSGVQQTIANLLRLNIIGPYVRIHLSADEHHAGSLYRWIHKLPPPSTIEESRYYNKLGELLIKRLVKNFLLACEFLLQKFPKFGGCKLKLHCEMGRGAYHRKLFEFLTEKEWNKLVILTEGLFNAGNALKLGNNITIPPDKWPPFLIIPGAEFFQNPIKGERCEAYKVVYKGRIRRRMYLCGKSKNSKGAFVFGFHNFIYNIFCGGTAEEALKIINDS